MTGLKVKGGAVGVWLFGLVIVYLAGLSMSGILFYIFLLYIAFPLLSLFLLFITLSGFRYMETFSNDHPRKGEEVVYQLTLVNETIVSGAYVDVDFLAVCPDPALQLEPLTTVIGRRKKLVRDYKICFPYRGVYTLGIQNMRLSDALAWLKFYPQVWPHTFYVYPRVVVLDRVFSSLRNSVEASGAGRGIIFDYTLYTDVREYRAGSSVKHMAWKKFAAVGEPFLKAYEKTSWPGVEIYLDLRREREADRAILEREDCSLEILVALYNYFLSRDVPVFMHGHNGRERYDFSGTHPGAFAAFYKATIGINFEGDVSPLSVFRGDLLERKVKAASVIVITHVFDPDLLETAARSAVQITRGSGSAGAEVAVFAVVNQTGMTAEERERNLSRVRDVPGLSAGLIFVDHPDEIKASLEQ